MFAYIGNNELKQDNDADGYSSCLVAWRHRNIANKSSNSDLAGKLYTGTNATTEHKWAFNNELSFNESIFPFPLFANF